ESWKQAEEAGDTGLQQVQLGGFQWPGPAGAQQQRIAVPESVGPAAVETQWRRVGQADVRRAGLRPCRTQGRFHLTLRGQIGAVGVAAIYALLQRYLPLPAMLRGAERGIRRQLGGRCARDRE